MPAELVQHPPLPGYPDPEGIEAWRRWWKARSEWRQRNLGHDKGWLQDLRLLIELKRSRWPAADAEERDAQ